MSKEKREEQASPEVVAKEVKHNPAMRVPAEQVVHS